MTTVYSDQNYNNENNSDELGYDLEFEKEIMRQGTEEMKEELMGKWKKRYVGVQIFPDTLKNINQGTINYLLSFNLVDAYNKMAKDLKLSVEQRDGLSRVVWMVIINNQQQDLEKIFQEKLKIDASVANQLAQEVNNNILSKISSVPAESSSRYTNLQSNKGPAMISLSINEAMKKYPKIGEQPITSNPIKLRHFPAPARPSIKNWIADFHDSMGVRKHGTIERGNYLFHSENTKNLNNQERQRLAYVLKSLDENMPLNVDTLNESIVFENKAGVNKTQVQDKGSVNNLESFSGEKERISFSSPHKFVTERNRSIIHDPSFGPDSVNDGVHIDSRVKGNVVNLRED